MRIKFTFDSLSIFFTAGMDPSIKLIVESNIKNIDTLPNTCKLKKKVGFKKKYLLFIFFIKSENHEFK
jgi:hypothetical protein